MKIENINGEVFEMEPYQLEGLEHLRANNRAGLFWEMSLGKTLVTLTRIKELLEGLEASRVLIIAPDKVARITWPSEIKNWKHLRGISYSIITGDEKQRVKALKKSADVYLIGAQNTTWLFHQFIKKRRGKYEGQLPYDVIVFDELTLFKSVSSERFKKMKRAVKYIDYRIGLTGTPMPNGEIDLYAQIFLLDDGQRLGKTFTEYVNQYFTTRGNGMITYEYKPRQGARKTIAKLISDIVSTKNTRDHIEMPKLVIVDEILNFDGFEKEMYDFLEKEYVLQLDDVEDVTVKTASDLSNKLLQLTSGAVYYNEQRDYMELNSLKLEVLGEIFDENPDDNFLIIYQFKHEVERIQARYPWVEFLDSKNAEEIVARWNRGEIRALLGHPAGMGHGLNMQFGGRRMVMYTVTWNLEHYLQVISRILRRGLDSDMYLHRLLVKGTRDMKVKVRLGGKQSNQQFLMEEVKDLRRKYGKKVY